MGLVRPRLAVASLGRSNEFGHPHPEPLALLAQRKIPLLWTDLDGTVTVNSDGKTWSVSKPRQLARGPPLGDNHVGRAKTKHDEGVKSPGKLLDVNSASQEELEALPGIGPTIARRIIEGRPYRTVEDLLRVSGIGEKRLAQIRSYVTAH